MGKKVVLSSGTEWEIPDRPLFGKTWGRMSEIALRRLDEDSLQCRHCGTIHSEQTLRAERKSLRFCSDCAGWEGVRTELEKLGKVGGGASNTA